MALDSPLITIGITCFNAQELIVPAIEHALQQEWPNKEVLVVDDGSSDDSVGVIEKYIEGHDNVKLIRHYQNKGFPSALNTVIENAAGEYIALFDDDDTSRSDRLFLQYQRLVKFIEKKQTPLIMCYTNRDVKYAGKNEVAYSFKSIGSQGGGEPHGEMVADYILWDNGEVGYDWGMFGSCTLMAHRDLFKKLGGFDPQFRRNAEWDMAVRCALEGGYFIGVSEPLVTQTKTPTSDKAGKKPLMFSIMLREKYKDYLKTKGVYGVSKIVARSRFYGGKGKNLLSKIFIIFAMILSPHKIGYRLLRSFYSRKLAGS